MQFDDDFANLARVVRGGRGANQRRRRRGSAHPANLQAGLPQSGMRYRRLRRVVRDVRRGGKVQHEDREMRGDVLARVRNRRVWQRWLRRQLRDLRCR
jgi:hypothetical protein